LIENLKNLLGADNVLSKQEAAPYFKDWRGRYAGNALAVVFPANTEQVSAVVQLCAAHQISIVPQGGNTSLCGGAVPLADGSSQLVINLSRLNKIRQIDATNYTMTAEAGCKLFDVRSAAEKHNRLFPLGLTATQKICEIGGNLSTNAGGINVLRYGNARDLVLGLEVVLPDGRIWNGLRSLRKDNSGYDLKHLFVGAEGTLGIITTAVLKLFPLPQTIVTACIAVHNPAAAVALLSHLRTTCGDRISGFEIVSRSCLDLVFKHTPDMHEPFANKHDWIVITQLADVLLTPLENALQDAIRSFGDGIVDFKIDTDAERANHWWKLRENIAEAQKAEGTSIKHDISVPVSRVAEFIERASSELNRTFAGIRIVAFGHMGDGNIHYNASHLDRAQNDSFIKANELKINRIVYQVVAELNGSISAEHGLGQLKREEITHYKSEIELDLMRSIKRVLDPKGLMNPGKVL